ncbi:DUF2271 domain-containing protein [Polyangium jinanense]|uniref:DUF2271 domain-containing protein n=1 Tax=Polyangium jinanense TaxID=2829994 RepID=A0A9X4AY77_9BACT|nr:DUF2271 domain-containing protein [Polyangium jinanense]MDC3960599.1 DUF2271 domain-containing protein [Polyangium jinanense]MDC3986887.1 DUF2271 domain-containing protein [Polyangium jinanense]
MLFACGPATQSDPAFWVPYRGDGSGGAAADAASSTGTGGTGGAGGKGGAAPASSTLEYRFTTVSLDGEYAPKNIGAVWITDAQDTFVKTLEVWAAKRVEHLVRWGAASGTNVVDAVTGATRKSHAEHVTTWNGTDTAGLVVPNGPYRVHVEFTEWNSSDSGEDPGPWTAVDFMKGPDAQEMTLPDEPAFIGRHLSWTP